MTKKEIKHRLTKQRKCILTELCKLCCHPTAEKLHNIVKKKMPNISLATIYRNLDFLEKSGHAVKVHCKCGCDNKARYDGNPDGHCHLVCKECGEVQDVFDCKNLKIKSKEIEKSGFEPCLSHLEIPGCCKKCNNRAAKGQPKKN